MFLLPTLLPWLIGIISRTSAMTDSPAPIMMSMATRQYLRQGSREEHHHHHHHDNQMMMLQQLSQSTRDDTIGDVTSTTNTSKIRRGEKISPLKTSSSYSSTQDMTTTTQERILEGNEKPLISKEYEDDEEININTQQENDEEKIGDDEDDDDDDLSEGSKNSGRVKLRRWELTDDSSRYERTIAAPSDQFLISVWYSWTVIAWMVAYFTLTIFCGILSSRRCRRNVFNLYLLFLMFPDILFSLLCGATCLLNATHGYYWTFGSQHDHHHDMMMDDVDTANNNFMCNFQQWYVTFGVGANAWLNAVITRQLHCMLRYSSKGRRYHPPSRRDVKIQSISIYLYVAFLGTWGLTLTRNPSSTVSNIFNKFPMSSGSYSGLACLPIEPDSTGGALFFWLIFFPLFVGIPVVYVLYVAWDVYHQNLLPPTGKRRMLTIYFGRLLLVFLVMWLPTFIILFVVGSWMPPWAHFVGGTWSHLQGAVSAGVSLLKEDIWNAVRDFVTCSNDGIDTPDSQPDHHRQVSSKSQEGTQKGSNERRQPRRDTYGQIFISSSSFRTINNTDRTGHNNNSLGRSTRSASFDGSLCL